MKTTPEQRALIREDMSDETRRFESDSGVYLDASETLALLDDLDEVLAQLRASHEVLADLRAMTLTSQREVALLAEVAALRAVAEAGRGLLGVLDGGPTEGHRADTATLRAALRAWEERER